MAQASPTVFEISDPSSHTFVLNSCPFCPVFTYGLHTVLNIAGQLPCSVEGGGVELPLGERAPRCDERDQHPLYPSAQQHHRLL